MSAQPSRDDDMVRHALDYAARGIRVFPCGFDKKPLTAHGLNDATTDSETIRRWWAQHPMAMIGAAMGKASGIFAIDPDAPKRDGAPDGLTAWHRLVATIGGHRPTHSHRTPSGGMHVLFAWPEARPVTNSRGSLPPGIDVRGEGGYVIMAPSRLPDGRAYELARHFDHGHFAEAPGQLLDLIEKKPPREEPPRASRENVTDFPGSHERYVAAAVDRECQNVAQAGAGGRNEALNRAAFALGTIVGAGHLDAGLARDRLLDAARSCRLVQDDGARAVLATIESGLTAGAAHPREMPQPRARAQQAENSHRRQTTSGEQKTEGTGNTKAGKSSSGSTAKDPDRLLVIEDAAALRFAELYKGRLRFCHDHGAWFEWDGSIWRKNATGLAFHWARELARQLAADENDRTKANAGKASFASSIERFCRSDPVFAVTAAIWDQDPFLLGTPAGTIDLRTGTLRPASPEDGITKAVAIAPGDQADCPLWLRFLNETTGDDTALVRFMQQWAGYALTGDTREHALVFVFGDGGNGKSVFLRILTGIMAAYATVASMDTFVASHGDRHSTDLAMLRGARLVTASETEEGRQWAEARIKALTGGDAISARFMRQDFFTFTPSFKLTVVGNHKPGLKSVDDAARRRFNLVPFTRKPAKVDPELADKLTAEWPAILRWMIDGCLDWQRNGLVRPDSIKEATAAYFDEQDVMSEWMAERCIVDRNNDARKSTTQELFASWSAFAKANNEAGGTVRGFSQKLQKLGFPQMKNVPQFAGGYARGFSGIDLRPTPQAGSAHGL